MNPINLGICSQKNWNEIDSVVCLPKEPGTKGQPEQYGGKPEDDSENKIESVFSHNARHNLTIQMCATI